MLKFTSLTIDNFGPYEGVQTIDFGSGDGVTLIWGDNGHGKTCPHTRFDRQKRM